MRPALVLATVSATLLAPARAALAQADVDPPSWAYPVNSGGGGGAAPDPGPHRLPDAPSAFTMGEIRNGFGPADWRPDLHPPMPEVVARGRAPDLRACGLCHMPNGQGRPENAAVSGLPAAYIVQQLEDFRSGRRKSSEPDMGPPAAMIGVARAATTAEAWAAAEYFASFPFTRWIRVVEAATVPRTAVQGGMYVPTSGIEPIGSRIVEVPEFPERTALRDPAAGFVAYVPPGTLERGRALAGGDDRTPACGTCHGDDLRGLGPVPPLAGRSPSYLFRQLYDFKTGARAGLWSDLMTGVVAEMSDEEMLALAGYAASLKP